MRVTVVAGDGTVLGDSDLDAEGLARVESHAGRPEIRQARRGGTGRAVRYSDTVAERLLYIALPLDPGDPASGVIRLAVPLTEVARVRRGLWLPLVWAAAMAVLAAATVGALLARRTARRLEEMARIASRIAAGDLTSRAVARGDDEVARLARALNSMAEQLEDRLALLDLERRQLRTILDGMVEGVLLTDATGTIIMANAAFERIFRAQPPVHGRRPLETARIPALQEAVDAALAAPEPLTREIVVAGAEETVIHASLAAVREDERTVGAVAVFHDVTRLRRLEQMRREFVANVSHELRTPLTAIKGYAETLRDGGLTDPAQATEFVGVIHRNAERLRSLIEELLELAKVERGQAALTLTPVAVAEVAAQAEAVARPLMHDKGHTLEVRVPDLHVVADRDRLAQVLINLLDNAAKFTPEGGRIVFSAAARDGRVSIEVADNGSGIPPDDLDRIFERFYRVDRSRDRREGGTGLGLSITKHLTQAMGGTIEVESAYGSGTTFRVTFPAA